MARNRKFQSRGREAVLLDPQSTDHHSFRRSMFATALLLAKSMPIGATCLVHAGRTTVETHRVADGWVVAAPSSKLTLEPDRQVPEWVHEFRLALSDASRKAAG
jgi:hypothetical protein